MSTREAGARDTISAAERAAKQAESVATYAAEALVRRIQVLEHVVRSMAPLAATASAEDRWRFDVAARVLGDDAREEVDTSTDEAKRPARVVNTDSFGGDYPDEHFVFGKMRWADAEVAAAALNRQAGPRASRFYTVVEDGYEARAGVRTVTGPSKCEHCGRMVGADDNQCEAGLVEDSFVRGPSAAYECGQVAAAREAGRQEERARIVTWLRSELGDPREAGENPYLRRFLKHTADLIKEGGHLEEQS